MENTQTATSQETTVMSVWPSISALRVGRALGRLYNMGPRVSLAGIPFRPGWLAALATLPLSVFLYFNKIVPRVPLVLIGVSNPFCRRYRLTTKRVVIEHPFDAVSKSRSGAAAIESVALADFDTIDLDQRPGQEWYRAADLVFRREGMEVLRLPAVPHAESFRQTCLKARQSRLAVASIQSSDAGPHPTPQGQA